MTTRFGLLAKMLLFILVPSVLGLVLISGLTYKMSESALSDQIQTDSKLLLQSSSTGMHAVTMGMMGSLKILAQNNRIGRYLELYNSGSGDALTSPEAAGADAALTEFTNTSENISYGGLIALDGKVIAHHVRGASGPSNTVGSDFTTRPYFKEAAQGAINIKSIISRTTGLPSVAIACPVMAHNKIVGVITLGMDSVALSSNTINKIAIGEHGFIAIYDMNGMVSMHPDSKSLGRDDSNVPHVKEMIKNGEGRVAYTNDKGSDKTVFFTHLPEEGWIIALELDRAEMLAPVDSMLLNTFLIALVCILLIGFIIFITARGIARQVRGFSSMAAEVAKGNLEIANAEMQLLSQAEKRKDEFSILGAGMRDMVVNIQNLLTESEQKTQAAEAATHEAREATAKAEEAGRRAESAKREGMLAAAAQLESVVESIASASTQLSAQIEQSDRSAVESARRLAEAATAMNEMNSTVHEVARNASSTASVSEDTKKNAASGSAIVNKALQSINQVHEASLELKTDMAQLDEHAQSITKIMNVISDIADQTNLLALNAAIEAARAGDAGRGFAVVADEVRNLAEKTVSSTSEVGAAIKSIQQSTTQSIATADKALQEVETATRFAGQSEEALGEIMKNAEQAAAQVAAIATASEQQSAASEEINQSIVQVNDMSSQTAAAMAEASRAVSELARQAQILDKLIVDMKQQ